MKPQRPGEWLMTSRHLQHEKALRECRDEGDLVEHANERLSSDKKRMGLADAEPASPDATLSSGIAACNSA